jgi:hypothetical protein
VWDSAIAGGWWRFASETPMCIFPEPISHYWVWRDDSKDWPGLFRSEHAEWLARLLEVSPEAPTSAASGRTDVQDLAARVFEEASVNANEKAQFHKDGGAKSTSGERGLRPEAETPEPTRRGTKLSGVIEDTTAFQRALSRHLEAVAKVERNFGCKGKPAFVEFYRPLGVTNAEFCAWKREDRHHCGRAKQMKLNKAADQLQ